MVEIIGGKYPNRKCFIPIPAGRNDVVLGRGAQLAPGVEYSDYFLRYNQWDKEETCLMSSLAAALEYFGLTGPAMFAYQEALEFVYLSASEQISAVFERLEEWIERKFRKEFYKVLKAQRASQIDVYNRPPLSLSLVIPIGSDGGSHHAVCIVCKGVYDDVLVFDSNEHYALKQSTATMNYVCAAKYLHVRYAIVLVFKNLKKINDLGW
jgi:hypothetical protein